MEVQSIFSPNFGNLDSDFSSQYLLLFLLLCSQSISVCRHMNGNAFRFLTSEFTVQSQSSPELQV